MSLTVSEFIDSRPLGWMQVHIFTLCGAIVLLDGYDFQALALAVPSIARQWAVAPSSFGWALSASLIGLGLASAFVAPLGDRLGRRPMLFGGLLLIGLASLGTMLVTTPLALGVCRFVTGAGLGICQTNATSLAVDWTPRKLRARVMTLLVCQVAVGALLAGFVAPYLIGHWGWSGIFFVGGVGPLALAALIATLPESLPLLARRDTGSVRFHRLVRRFSADAEISGLMADPSIVKVPGSIRTLISATYRRRTLAYWAVYTFAAFLLYLLVSWLPVILGNSGWSRDSAVRGIVLLQGGGILGSLVIARYIDRRLTIPVLCAAYVLGGIAALGFTLTSAAGAAWPVLLILMGTSVSGGQFGILAVGALLYPPELRAAGLGTGAAVARLGAVAGPLAGGWVIASGAPSASILAWLAVPSGLAALIIALLRRELGPDATSLPRTTAATTPSTARSG